jgi:phosphatidylinositol alpha-mannosyltransferase
MRRILGETTAGVLVPPGDSAALAAAIITLLGDERRRCTLGRNGRQAVVTRYRWSVDAGRLVAAIEAAASARPPAR